MEMYNKLTHISPEAFFLILHHFEIQEMCIKGVEVDPWQLHHVPDHLKTMEMCDKTLRGVPSSLEDVPDCLMTQGQAKYGRITMTITTIMDFLSGTKIIKNARHRKHK